VARIHCSTRISKSWEWRALRYPQWFMTSLFGSHLCSFHISLRPRFSMMTCHLLLPSLLTPAPFTCTDLNTSSFYCHQPRAYLLAKNHAFLLAITTQAQLRPHPQAPKSFPLVFFQPKEPCQGTCSPNLASIITTHLPTSIFASQY